MYGTIEPLANLHCNTIGAIHMENCMYSTIEPFGAIHTENCMYGTIELLIILHSYECNYRV
jgi:hypothetical protein